jgi:protein involved in polysaccharide export with SLBB domain
MKYTVLFMIFTVCLVTAVETSASTLPNPVVTEDYILMPGDSVLITITGATNYSYITGITYEGKVTLNMPVASAPTMQGVYLPQYDVVAAIPVYGLSLSMAKDSIARVFAKYLRNVDIDITLVGMRTFIVLVVGEITKPGMVQATPIHRVSTVIDEAGGISAIGSHANIQLKRGTKTTIVNLDEFERAGDLNANPYVQDGDVILIPKMKMSVVVKGAVFGKRAYELRVAELTASRERTSEGLYELIGGERVSDLLTKAGGITPWADALHAYIERNDQKLYIDLHAVVVNPDTSENIVMLDGDVLVVPSVNSVVYVQGHVVTPGALAFQPYLKASDYIGIAGGPLGDANISGAHIKRAQKKIPIKDDPFVEEGDVVFVPRQAIKWWQDYLEITSVIATLVIAYLSIRQ